LLSHRLLRTDLTLYSVPFHASGKHDMSSPSLFNKRGSVTLALAAALLASIAAPAAAQNADMVKAVEAWRSGDDLAAVRVWMPLAERGNADAQFNLGQAFKLGRGVAQDIAMAEVWYRRAAQQGHLQAEDNLGLVLFASGQRVGAMHYIRRSAARGEARALFLLGTAHFNGDLAAQDWPRAYALIRRASETGLSLASERVAELDQLIPEQQRQQGLAMMPRLLEEEKAARTAANAPARPAAPVDAAQGNTPPVETAAAETPPPAAPAMIAMAPSAINAKLDGAQLIEPEILLPERPKAGVTFTPPPLPTRPAPAKAPAVTTPAVTAPSVAAPVVAAPAVAAPAVAKPAQSDPSVSATPPTSPRSIELPPSNSAPDAINAETAETQPGILREAVNTPPPAPVAPPPAPAPTPAPAPVKKSPPPAATAKPATGPWRLQLGAFSQSENAQRLWTQLGSKYPEIARRRPIISSSGRFTMLYAGQFTSRNEASDLCNKLKNGDQACLILD
jgi:cell division septation protein DedD